VPAAQNAEASNGVIIFSHQHRPSGFADRENTIAAVILQTLNKEDGQLAKVRGAIEAEFKRAGCTDWDYRQQLKLS
jgi:hypothetical protein